MIRMNSHKTVLMPKSLEAQNLGPVGCITNRLLIS